MKIVCITDVHGFLDKMLRTLENVEDKKGLDLLKDGKWSSKHNLLLNGDMFDRGPKNKESLEWALENADVYNIGNHEFFAMFPDITNEFMSDTYFEQHGSKGLYWRDMDEEMRQRLLKAVAEGEITAAFEGSNYIYSHSGSEEGPDTEDLNRKLTKVGRKLLKAHTKMLEGNTDAYLQAQRDLIEVVKTENGKELRGKYPKLFDAHRNENGAVIKGGIVWNRFHKLKTDTPQIVGHTRGSYLTEQGLKMNPQWNQETLNINTIRDAVKGESLVAVTIEDEENLEILCFELS